MNRIHKSEREQIDDHAKFLYVLHGREKRAMIVSELVKKFNISKFRAMASFGRAMMYYNHPDRNGVI